LYESAPNLKGHPLFYHLTGASGHKGLKRLCSTGPVRMLTQVNSPESQMIVSDQILESVHANTLWNRILGQFGAARNMPHSRRVSA